MISVTYTIEIRHLIRGFDCYGFGTDKRMYNIRTGRIIRQCYNSGSIGYWMSGKFVPIKAVKKIAYKATTSNTCPF